VVSASERYRAFRRACWEDQELARRMIADDHSVLDLRSGLGETALHDIAIETGADAALQLAQQFLLPARPQEHPH
jgi:hypothetical protein